MIFACSYSALATSFHCSPHFFICSFGLRNWPVYLHSPAVWRNSATVVTHLLGTFAGGIRWGTGSGYVTLVLPLFVYHVSMLTEDQYFIVHIEANTVGFRKWWRQKGHDSFEGETSERHSVKAHQKRPSCRSCSPTKDCEGAIIHIFIVVPFFLIFIPFINSIFLLIGVIEAGLLW